LTAQTINESDQEERLLLALERIACAFEGLRDEAKRAGAVYWPQKQVQKEAIVSRVETNEDRELKMQGARRRTINEIIDPDVEESSALEGGCRNIRKINQKIQ
jgi:hypothetical protein